MYQLSQHLAILRKTLTLHYRESLFGNMISQKITVHKVRHVTSKEDITDGENYCTQLSLHFSAIVGYTSNAYLLKDTNEQLYLIPFKEIPREETHRLLTEPFQLIAEEHGKNPQFISNSSLQTLLTATQPQNTVPYASFDEWECGRAYLIKQDSTIPKVDAIFPSSILLRYVADVGHVKLFKVVKAPYYENGYGQATAVIHSGGFVTNLFLSTVINSTADVTPLTDTKPFSNATIRRVAYDHIPKMLTCPEYVSKVYPKFNSKGFIPAQSAEVTWRQLHQSGATNAHDHYMLNAMHGMDELTLEVAVDNNGEDTCVSVQLDLADMPVNAALSLLLQLKSNVPKKTVVVHNLDPAESAFLDEIHEDITDLVEAVNLHSAREQNGKDLTLFKDFADTYSVKTTYEIQAVALDAQKVLSFYSAVFKDLKFKVHQIDSFIFF